MSELGTIKVTSADVKQMLTLNVKISRTIGPRLWVCAQVMKLAALIGGVGISVEVVDENEASRLSR